MPHLQMHQLRVAAVVAKICDTFSISINKTAIITAALVHDMGNLIKSDFSTNYFALTPQEIDYWEGVKKEFIEKYGNNVHEATLSILKEIRISADVLHLVEHNDFKYICEIAESDSLEKKILKYSDLRVGLHGVLSIDERFEDIIKRYLNLLDGDRKECAENIENEIFSYSNLKPSDINDESIVEIIEQLKNFEI